MKRNARYRASGNPDIDRIERVTPFLYVAIYPCGKREQITCNDYWANEFCLHGDWEKLRFSNGGE